MQNTLFLVPFRAEAKLLTGIMPNCSALLKPSLKKGAVSPSFFSFSGGEILFWNQAGSQGTKEIIEGVGDFSKYSSVVIFGTAGALVPQLEIGQVFCCTHVKDTFGGQWQLPMVKGLKENTILSTNALVFDNNERKALNLEYNCNLVDMETATFAKMANEGAFGDAKTYAIRVVSDSFETLPNLDLNTNNFIGKLPQEVRDGVARVRKVLLEL